MSSYKANEPIRVLHVVQHLNIGGAELRLRDLARQLDWSRFQLHFCTLAKDAGELSEEIQSLGGHFHHAALGVRFSERFKQILLNNKIDVVHAHLHYSSGFVLRLAAQAKVPGRIVHFQSCSDGQESNLRRNLQRRIMRHWIHRHASHIVACGENAMIRSWRSDWKQDPRCQVIFDGIDSTPFEMPCDKSEVASEFTLSRKAPLYIHVGNFRRPKNHLKLISVFSHIVRHEPDAKLLLVGKDISNSEKAIRKKILELALTESVIFAGTRRDVPRLLRAADALIFPSLWEGLPGTVLEACAAGTPVIASDLPEIREIADWFSLVNCIPLEVSDADWAQETLKWIKACNSSQIKETTSETFSNTPFHIRKCIADTCRLWQDSCLSSFSDSGTRAA